MAPVVPFIPAILAVAGTAMSASAARKESAANEAIANREAAFQQGRTALESSRFADEVSTRAGTQTASLSKYGRAGTESALDVLEAQTKQDELDAAIIRMGGDVASSRFRAEAESTKAAGNSKVAGTLLSGGSRAYSLLPA